MAVSMQVPLFAVDLDWEQVCLFECLDQLLLFSELGDVLDLGLEWATNSGSHSHGFAVLVEFNPANRGAHDGPSLVDPVTDECSSGKLGGGAPLVHVFPDEDSHYAHSTLEGQLLDLEGDKPSLFSINGIEDRCLVSLESHRVLWCDSELVVKRVILVRRGGREGTSGGERQDSGLA